MSQGEWRTSPSGGKWHLCPASRPSLTWALSTGLPAKTLEWFKDRSCSGGPFQKAIRCWVLHQAEQPVRPMTKKTTGHQSGQRWRFSER